MNFATKLAVAGGVLLAAPWAGTSLAAAAPVPVTAAPAALIASTGTGRLSGVTGRVASGSVAAEPGFDPGPYPSWDACERARAKYYDPSRLECVPA
ncbi:hypothetical protein [Nocardia blacklockiae]|uniref:hypothetical protein n=1 Tax=Nocardia blacklockiae TaxID=480036 RepID=UPI001894E0D2|nr:hypothetical protein [Nocardia blacklockiae]MBF6174886.1 hypothetical protein [Nocardia blacklockiae]